MKKLRNEILGLIIGSLFVSKVFIFLNHAFRYLCSLTCIISLKGKVDQILKCPKFVYRPDGSTVWWPSQGWDGLMKKIPET